MRQKTGKYIIKSLILILLLNTSIFWIPVSAEDDTIQATPLIIIESPEIIEIGDRFMVNVTIDSSLPPLFPDKAILIIKAPMNSQADAFTSITLRSRKFNRTFDADATGEWTFACRYGDLTSETVSLKVIPRIKLKETYPTITPYITPVHSGSLVELTGYLRDTRGLGISNRQVSFEVAYPPYGCGGFCDLEDDQLIWEIQETVWTDEFGKFTMIFSAIGSGRTSIKAYFNGDEIYEASKTDVNRVTVT